MDYGLQSGISKVTFVYVNATTFSFLVHSRALIFPLLIRAGKPTPFFIFVLALLFCTYNGYLQGRSLTNYARYPSDWLKDPCFIIGELKRVVRGLAVVFLCHLQLFIFSYTNSWSKKSSKGGC